MKYRNCIECGLIEEYCEKCKVYHHKDNFEIEHKDYQQQLNIRKKK